MAARRQRVERGIYRRTAADGKVAYEIGYRDSDGRQRWQRVEGGVKAARAARADVLARMGKGQRVAPTPRLTFGEAAARWQEAQAASLRPTTRSTYDTHLRTHLLTRWERRRLDSIEVDDVARLVEDMRRSGLKAWTIRGALVVAGRIFDFSRRRCGWAGENPVRLLDRSERPRSDQRERRVLSGEELERLIAAADDRHRPIFAFAATTGARLGETLGLRWRSVDLESGSASITHQVDRQRRYVELKTARSRRTVELPSSLVSMLRARKLEVRNSSADDYVFSTRTGGPLEHRNVAGRPLRRAFERAGLEEDGTQRPTFHALRHGFASWERPLALAPPRTLEVAPPRVG